MNAREAARVAFTAIRANGLRSFLTVLGVVIGVMAVVVLVAVGTGARDEVTAGVEDLGSNLLVVVPGALNFGQAPTVSKFTLDDVAALERALGPDAVAASLASGETVRATGRQATRAGATGAGHAGAFATVLGVTEDFDDVLKRGLTRGEFISASDVRAGRRVAVLGASAAEALFPDRDALGKTVSVGGLRFRVVGELDRLGSALGVDRDAQVLVPVTAAQRLFGARRVDTIFVRAGGTGEIDATKELIGATLAAHVEGEDYTVVSQEEILGVAGRFLSMLTLVLAAIAGVSLLVGGIGVSNIMLVSVSERTREIGLRKALGARTRDISLQFLIEAVVLCGAGGVIGIGVGLGLAAAAAAFTPLPATVTAWSIALAFTTSLLVGVVFGVFPARRAGRLDPVVALRHE